MRAVPVDVTADTKVRFAMNQALPVFTKLGFTFAAADRSQGMPAFCDDGHIA
jgi:hypothetical protein